MEEALLRQFFEGSASATQLAADVRGALEHSSARSVRFWVTPMKQAFTVTSDDVAKVVDAVLHDGLSPNSLEAVCVCLVVSSAFAWDRTGADGARVTESLGWLRCVAASSGLMDVWLSAIERYLRGQSNTIDPTTLPVLPEVAAVRTINVMRRGHEISEG